MKTLLLWQPNPTKRWLFVSFFWECTRTARLASEILAATSAFSGPSVPSRRRKYEDKMSLDRNKLFSYVHQRNSQIRATMPTTSAVAKGLSTWKGSFSIQQSITFRVRAFKVFQSNGGGHRVGLSDVESKQSQLANCGAPHGSPPSIESNASKGPNVPVQCGHYQASDQGHRNGQTACNKF